MSAPPSNPVVELSVAPGHTWLTAPDHGVARLVRETITEAGCSYWQVRQGGRVVELIVDLSSGLRAMLACEALAAAGVRFRWHPEQDPAVREGGWERDLPGMV